MDQKNTVDRVIRVVEEQLGIDAGTAKPESHLEDDLDADSLDRIEIVLAIEEEFSIAISDQEAETFKTVSELADLVTRKGGK